MTQKRVKVWMGTTPVVCQQCGEECKARFYDAKSRYGPWALFCHLCFEAFGVGLGTGKGQRYDWDLDRQRFVKTGG